MSHDGMRKVNLALEPDEHGWPRSGAEGLWANAEGGDHYRLDNIPWFARDVSNGDLVVATEDGDGRLWFERVVERSGHATYRVIVDDPDDIQAARDGFRALGVQSELDQSRSLISLDVPTSVRLTEVEELLAREKEAGRWDYEEGSLPQERLGAEK